MNHMEALRAFTRVVELGTFSAAARDLRIRQSTVSKWVASLEDELGVQLLDRTTRTLAVTDAGRAFYENALNVLAAWEHAFAQARAERVDLAGKVRVSVPVVFGQLHITPLLPGWLGEHPALELEVVYSDRYVDLVEEGVDLAVRVGLPVDSEYRATLLARAGRVLVASPSLLRRTGIIEDPRQLESHSCLTHRGLDNRATWVFARDGEELQRVAVRGRVSTNNSAALRDLAIAGFGFALLADWLVAPALRRGELVQILPEYALPAAPVRAIIASGRYVHPRVRLFIEYLREHLSRRLAM
ncbi:MAG: LysR family transcriptional regulator [Myxococcota bacterium]